MIGEGVVFQFDDQISFNHRDLFFRDSAITVILEREDEINKKPMLFLWFKVQMHIP